VWEKGGLKEEKRQFSFLYFEEDLRVMDTVAKVTSRREEKYIGNECLTGKRSAFRGWAGTRIKDQ